MGDCNGLVHADVHADVGVKHIFKMSTQVNAKVRQVLLAFRKNTTNSDPSLLQLLAEVPH